MYNSVVSRYSAPQRKPPYVLPVPRFSSPPSRETTLPATNKSKAIAERGESKDRPPASPPCCRPSFLRTARRSFPLFSQGRLLRTLTSNLCIGPSTYISWAVAAMVAAGSCSLKEKNNYDQLGGLFLLQTTTPDKL